MTTNSPPDSRGEPSYLHGYAAREQQRLISQAEFWREVAITDGTTQLAPGTRLLDVGCGVGAVMAILGEAFPGIHLSGVDIAPEQIAFARGYLTGKGLDADLAVADASRLPYADDSFDHVWMMWFLEHLKNPVDVLREARRVLVPGGTITVWEPDYASIRASPSTRGIEAIIAANRIALAATGAGDAGPNTAGWLAEAGFTDVDPGRRATVFGGARAITIATRMASAAEELIPTFLTLPGTATEATLRQGLRDLAAFAALPNALPDPRFDAVNYKAQARA